MMESSGSYERPQQQPFINPADLPEQPKQITAGRETPSGEITVPGDGTFDDAHRYDHAKHITLAELDFILAERPNVGDSDQGSSSGSRFRDYVEQLRRQMPLQTSREPDEQGPSESGTGSGGLHAIAPFIVPTAREQLEMIDATESTRVSGIPTPNAESAPDARPATEEVELTTGQLYGSVRDEIRKNPQGSEQQLPYTNPLEALGAAAFADISPESRERIAQYFQEVQARLFGTDATDGGRQGDRPLLVQFDQPAQQPPENPQPGKAQ